MHNFLLYCYEPETCILKFYRPRIEKISSIFFTDLKKGLTVVPVAVFLDFFGASTWCLPRRWPQLLQWRFFELSVWGWPNMEWNQSMCSEQQNPTLNNISTYEKIPDMRKDYLCHKVPSKSYVRCDQQAVIFQTPLLYFLSKVSFTCVIKSQVHFHSWECLESKSFHFVFTRLSHVCTIRFK